MEEINKKDSWEGMLKLYDDGEITGIAMASEQFVKEQVALCEHQIHLLRGDFNEYKEVEKALYNLTHDKISELYKTIKDLSMQIEKNKNNIALYEQQFYNFRMRYYKIKDLTIQGLISMGIILTFTLVLVVLLYVK